MGVAAVARSSIRWWQERGEEKGRRAVCVSLTGPWKNRELRRDRRSDGGDHREVRRRYGDEALEE